MTRLASPLPQAAQARRTIGIGVVDAEGPVVDPLEEREDHGVVRPAQVVVFRERAVLVVDGDGEQAAAGTLPVRPAEEGRQAAGPPVRPACGSSSPRRRRWSGRRAGRRQWSPGPRASLSGPRDPVVHMRPPSRTSVNSNPHWRRNASQSNGATVRNVGRPSMSVCSSACLCSFVVCRSSGDAVIHSRSSTPSFRKPGRAVSITELLRDLERSTAIVPQHEDASRFASRVASASAGRNTITPLVPSRRYSGRSECVGRPEPRVLQPGPCRGGGAVLGAAGRAAERHHGGRHAEEKHGRRQPTRPRPRAVDHLRIGSRHATWRSS